MGVMTSSMERATAKSAAQYRVRRLVGNALSYGLLLFSSLSCLFPLYWMLATSLKTEAEANAPRIVWWPEQPTLAAYEQILTDPQWWQYMGNSLFVTLLAVVGTTLSVVAVAFAFSRIEWPGRNLVFFLMLATLMLPPQTTLVPQYVLFNSIGWVGTFNPIVLPGFFAGGASLIFLLRQFMLTLPKEIDEAALIDGAGYPTIFWKIMLPLSVPIVATVIMFVFVNQWNNLQGPLIYLQNGDLYTLPVAIASLINPQQTTQPWPTIMAASVITTIPLLLAFLATQRYLLDSIVLTGSK
jgi:multiple sugar transport system permease protein